MIKLVSMDEVFAMAVQIEDNAARFYRKAADLSNGKSSTDVFEKLAAMEDGHKQKFAAMREAAPRPSDGPEELEQEGAMYLEAIASGYRVEGSPKVAEELTGDESVVDILRLATELEKQAILFYLGLKKVVSDAPTQQVLDDIIDEEKEHFVSLIVELRKEEGT
ncbi:MAG: ferritin family protein [Pontiella sp.]|nr:ferritin family protein [Pontiella sp.]